MNGIDLLNLLDTLSIHRRKIIRSLDTSRLNLPINTTQERVLMAILKFPDINMKELSAYAGLEKSSLTRVIDSLIEEGFVMRSYHTVDRRRISCALTKKGLSQGNRINKLMKKHADNYFAELPPGEKKALINSLTAAVNIFSEHFR